MYEIFSLNHGRIRYVIYRVVNDPSYYVEAVRDCRSIDLAAYDTEAEAMKCLYRWYNG